jgi:hypothetical protein
MFNIIKSMLTDVDQQASSKRFAFLWLVIIIWSFAHIMLFIVIKPIMRDLVMNIITYDLGLIAALGGLVLAEKVWGRPTIPTDSQTPEQPKP